MTLELKRTAIIFDIDGVVCDSSSRFKRLNIDAYIKKDKKAFANSIKWYEMDCEGDTIIESGVKLLESLTNTLNISKVFFITARGEGGREPTMRWLSDSGIIRESDELIMHPEALDEEFEFKTPAVHANWKKQEAEKIMKQYNVLFAVDDSEDNINAYSSLGITCIKFISPMLGRVLV